VQLKCTVCVSHAIEYKEVIEYMFQFLDTVCHKEEQIFEYLNEGPLYTIRLLEVSHSNVYFKLLAQQSWST
jgi:hypothetical protein